MQAQNITVYWRGSILANSTSSLTPLICCAYSTPETPPYVNYGVMMNASGPGVCWQAAYGSSQVGSSISVPLNNQVVSAGATFAAGGNATLYYNGVGSNVNTVPGSITYGSTASILLNGYNPNPGRYAGGVCMAAYIFGRTLSAQEMALLHLDPYSFLNFNRDYVASEIVSNSGSLLKKGGQSFNPIFETFG